MSDRRTGIWLIGANGAVAICTVVGARALAAGLIDRTGMVSELAEFQRIGLVEPDQLVFGGCDVRRIDPAEAAREFAHTNGVIQDSWIDALADDLAAYAANQVPGLLTNTSDAVGAMADWRSGSTEIPGEVDRIRAALRAFREDNRLDRVIVVHVASAEPRIELAPELTSGDPGALRRRIEAGKAEGLPLSSLYAFAALEEGCGYVNFTASIGASCATLSALAEEKGCPTAGRDGKTGETLVKTVLAPLFHARHLKLLAWESHNILGNRDGRILSNPAHKEDKVANKTQVLNSLIDQREDPHHSVRIDYVPSLGDWKTAWDFIHFQGFMGAKMSLQFTWQGSDSALAAPLVLDLARFVDLALQRGESGVQTHLACFFKNPAGTDEHDFGHQFELLTAFAATLPQSTATPETAPASEAR
jgi:myo-inositol-1-phosphate synthase